MKRAFLCMTIKIFKLPREIPMCYTVHYSCILRSKISRIDDQLVSASNLRKLLTIKEKAELGVKWYKERSRDDALIAV